MKPIFYAEDNDDDVLFIQKAFKETGVNNPLVVVADGFEAMAYLAGNGNYADRARHPLPCLALLDINLPGKSGLEVLKCLRVQPATCSVPALMLTSSSHEADIHRAYLQGANGFLQKPGSPNEFVRMVEAIRDYWLRQNKTAGEGLVVEARPPDLFLGRATQAGPPPL
jgi:CheY-like chemotaxis protein